jgi:hypothetical protein
MDRVRSNFSRPKGAPSDQLMPFPTRARMSRSGRRRQPTVMNLPVCARLYPDARVRKWDFGGSHGSGPAFAVWPYSASGLRSTLLGDPRSHVRSPHRRKICRRLRPAPCFSPDARQPSDQFVSVRHSRRRRRPQHGPARSFPRGSGLNFLFICEVDMINRM